MVRKNLLQWQFASYHENHRNPINLTIHKVAVPIFWISLGSFFFSAAVWSLLVLFASLLGLMSSLGAQAIGHRLEEKQPEPFSSPIDFISRLLAEQLFTFPKYILSLGSTPSK